MLNRRVHPRVPSQGSVGASGDLAPLAHLALVVIGEGEAVVGGSRLAIRLRAGAPPPAAAAASLFRLCHDRRVSGRRAAGECWPLCLRALRFAR